MPGFEYIACCRRQIQRTALPGSGFLKTSRSLERSSHNAELLDILQTRLGRSPIPASRTRFSTVPRLSVDGSVKRRYSTRVGVKDRIRRFRFSFRMYWPNACVCNHCAAGPFLPYRQNAHKSQICNYLYKRYKEGFCRAQPNPELAALKYLELNRSKLFQLGSLKVLSLQPQPLKPVWDPLVDLPETANLSAVLKVHQVLLNHRRRKTSRKA